MIVVSNDFKTAMKEPVKELQAFIDAGDGNRIADDGDLISIKVSCDGGLCKSVMRKLEAKYLGEHNLVGKWVTAGFGVKLASGTFEPLTFGSFLVSEQTTTKDTGVTEIVAYDKMISAMQPYDAKLFQDAYPTDVFTYAGLLCNACGLELGNTDFSANGDFEIAGELFENINGITYRDIFVKIAQATATTCIISDEKVYFKPITATRERLTYDNLFKLKLEPEYGEINSIVLSRAPQEDNVYFKDDQSIDIHGLTEFRIENNEIVDKDREGAIVGIGLELLNKSYYPFEATTEGLGWYEIGDYIEIVNDAGDHFPTAVWSYSITVDGGIKETLKASAETKTQTQYQYATTIEKRVKTTEMIVNKQEEYIQSFVGEVDANHTQIRQDIENIIQSVQNNVGSNLLKNSVMFAYDSDGKPYNWECWDDGGVLTIQSDAEALLYGGVSGHSFTLTNKAVQQDVSVKISADDDPAPYTFSCRIKKDAVGDCTITIHNDYEEREIWLPDGVGAYYDEFEITGLHPKQNFYTVSISSRGGNGATITDCMFASGEYKSKWTQANGEVMNTQVNVSVDGVLVRSSVYQGDYTVMSPLEFAGYSNIGGVLTRVFSLNKDVTRVRKLDATDEIKMCGIKIVPVTDGALQGWAFVPTT